MIFKNIDFKNSSFIMNQNLLLHLSLQIPFSWLKVIVCLR